MEISATKLYWKAGLPTEQDICKYEVIVPVYDVRGREKAAYHCLKPQKREIAICKTQYQNQNAEISMTPGIWIRNWKSNSLRAHRFHAYIQAKADPNLFLDIFSRHLSENLSSQGVILEGSKKSSPSSLDNE